MTPHPYGQQQPPKPDPLAGLRPDEREWLTVFLCVVEQARLKGVTPDEAARVALEVMKELRPHPWPSDGAD